MSNKKEDYDKLSLKVCESKLKGLNKTLADLNKQTDPKKFEQAKKAKSQEINSLKVRSAEIKWKMEARQTEKSEVVKAQDQSRKALKNSHEQLDGFVQGRRRATDTLKSNFGGRRIKKPDEHLKTLKRELQSALASLKTADLSNQEERQLHRKISDMKAGIANTEKYIKDKVSDLYSEQDKKKQEMSQFMGSHVETQAVFQKAKTNADKLFKDLSDLRDERESIAGDIKMLSEEKNTIISKYSSANKKRNDTERDIARCKRAIDDKKLERSMQTAPKPVEKRKKVERKQEKKEEEVQSAVPVVSLDERRAAAIAAYEAMQKEKEQKLQAQNIAQTSPVKIESTQAPVLTEDAKLCQTLISLCQNMKPKQSNSPSKSKKSKKKKRKQKKMRLTHAPDTFSNFARLGVNIPVWTQDLDQTISALQERLEQCSGNEENEV